MNPDIVNGIFEGGGAFLLLLNVQRLYFDKKLSGVALAPTIWFNVWGAWNLYYYAKLNQPLSWSAGLLVFMVNTTWVAMAIYYTQRNKKPVVKNELRAVDFRYQKGEHLPFVLELSDGRLFRTRDSMGIVWYDFPSGLRPKIEFECWLDEEMNRVKNLNKWSEADIIMQRQTPD